METDQTVKLGDAGHDRGMAAESRSCRRSFFHGTGKGHQDWLLTDAAKKSKLTRTRLTESPR
jgi:hypothetical protein